jgi:hypothetical protein
MLGKIKNTCRYVKSNQFMQMISVQINLEDDIKLYIDIEKGDDNIVKRFNRKKHKCRIFDF